MRYMCTFECMRGCGMSFTLFFINLEWDLYTSICLISSSRSSLLRAPLDLSMFTSSSSSLMPRSIELILASWQDINTRHVMRPDHRSLHLSQKECERTASCLKLSARSCTLRWKAAVSEERVIQLIVGCRSVLSEVLCRSHHTDLHFDDRLQGLGLG